MALSSLFWMLALLGLSVWVLQTTQSYALSAAVFGAQWVLPLMWPGGIGRFGRRLLPARRAAISDVSSAVVVLLVVVGVVAEQPLPVLGLVAVRGFLEAVTRANAALAAMSSVEVEHREGVAARLEFFRLLGTSAAGLCFALTAGIVGVVPQVFSAAGALLLTACCYALLSRTTNKAHDSVTASKAKPRVRLRTVLNQHPAARAALWQLAIVAAFQGVHNAIRVAYPDQVLGEPVTGVGIVSAVSTVAVLCGGWVASRPRAIGRLRSFPPWTLTGTVATLAITAVGVTVPVASYAIYFAFMLLFEVAFMTFNVGVVAHSEGTHGAVLLGVRSAVLGAGTLVGLAVPAMLLTLLPVWPTTAAAALFLATGSALLHQRALRTSVKEDDVLS